MKNDHERSNRTRTAPDRKSPPVYLGVLLIFIGALECLALFKLFSGNDFKKTLAAFVSGIGAIAAVLRLMNEKFLVNPWGDTIFSIFNYGVFARLRGLQRSLSRLCIAGGFLLLALAFFLCRVGQTRDLVRTYAVVDDSVHNFQYSVKYYAYGETYYTRFPAVLFSPHFNETIPVAYDSDEPQIAYPASKAALYGGPMEVGLLGLIVLVLSGYPEWLIRFCLLGKQQEESNRIVWEDETDE